MPEMYSQRYSSTLWNKYKDVCNSYLKKFCEKHGYDYEDAKELWVGDFVGGITCCGDNFVSLETIIIDIENDVDEGEFLKWYDYCLECGDLDIVSCNYESWLKGCPRLSDEEIEEKRKIKRMNGQKRIHELKKQITKLIDEYVK